MKNYSKVFGTKSEALNFMSMKNRAASKAGNYNDIFVMVDGPSNNFAVVDLFSAIELGILFTKS